MRIVEKSKKYVRMFFMLHHWSLTVGYEVELAANFDKARAKYKVPGVGVVFDLVGCVDDVGHEKRSRCHLSRQFNVLSLQGLVKDSLGHVQLVGQLGPDSSQVQVIPKHFQVLDLGRLQTRALDLTDPLSNLIISSQIVILKRLSLLQLL